MMSSRLASALKSPVETPVKSTIGKQRKQRDAPKKEKRIEKKVSKKTQDETMFSCGVTGHFILENGNEWGLTVRIAGPTGLLEAFEETWNDYYGEDSDETPNLPPALDWIFVVLATLEDSDGTPYKIDCEAEGQILLATRAPAETPDKLWWRQNPYGDALQITLPYDPVKYGEHYAKMGFL